MSSQGFLCTLGVFPALAFAADFPPVAPEFQRRTHRWRLLDMPGSKYRLWRRLFFL